VKKLNDPRHIEFEFLKIKDKITSLSTESTMVTHNEEVEVRSILEELNKFAL
jgi:hypothetical protein